MFFPKRRQLLRNKELDNQLDKCGFVKFGKIDEKIIEELKAAYKELVIPDSYGFGFNVGLNTEEIEIRRKMQELITKIIEKPLLDYFINRKVFTATFMNKVSGKKFLLPPHQDWTYTDEKNDDSVMCWIPLIDVTSENGAMCFMPHSHKLFSYDRGFPLSYMPSPVNELNYALLPYMKVIEATAGEIIVINHKTVHASLPNLTANERVAVGVSVSPKNEKLIIKCLNPKNKGKSLLTFEVDTEFLVKNRHVDLAKSYDNGTAYDFEYQLLEEKRLKIPKVKLIDVEKFAKKNKIEFNPNLQQKHFNN